MVTYDWTEYHVLIISYLGIVKGYEVVNSALEISGDFRFDSTRYVLCDWTRAERTEVSADDVLQLIAVMKSVCKICPTAKNACVIKPDRDGNPLMAFYKMLADELSWSVDIFKEYEEAFNWFGFPESQWPRL